jgi:peptide/nickel transport system substrate-binding protein
MKRLIATLLTFSLIMTLAVVVSPVSAEEEHYLHKYITAMTHEKEGHAIPEVEDYDAPISAEEFSNGLSIVLGKDVSYEGEDFNKAEMFKFAIDNHESYMEMLPEYDFDIWCLALDEETIPEEYWPYFNLASRPICNILTYRFRETAWSEQPSYAEAAFLLYRFKYPPNTDPEQMVTCVTQQEPDTLNPYVSSAMSRTFLVAFLGTGSVTYGDDVILYPNIVKRRPSLDNGDVKIFEDEVTGNTHMSVTFELRPNMYWPSLEGEPEGSRYHEITADDVIFGMREGMCPKIQSVSRSGDWKIESVKKINKYTVETIFNEEYAYATWGLPGLSFKDFYEKELITNPDHHNVRQDFYDYQIGPYKIKEWNQGNYFDFEPNPYAVFAQPLIPNIRVKFMSDNNTIKLNLKGRNIDLVYNAFSPLEAKDIEGDLSDSYSFYYVESTGWEHIDLNQFEDDPDNPDDVGLAHIFGDKRVRQALLYALDRDKLCRLVSEGVFTPSHAWMTRRSKYYQKAEEAGAIKKYEYNPEKAQQLLEEAGWMLSDDGFRYKNGKKLAFKLATTSGAPFRLASVENIIMMWRQLGIDVKSDFKSPTAMFGGDYLRRHQFEAAEFAWVSNPIRPNANLWSNEQIPTEENGWMGQNQGGWYGGENSEEHQELVELILRELPDDELQDAINKQFKIWTEELPALPLYNRYNVDVVKRNLENYKPTGAQQPPNWNCEFWYLEQ